MDVARRLPSTDDREQHASRSPSVRACARLADSPAFNVAIFGVIVANAVVLGLETYDGVLRAAGGTLHVLNQLFLAVFVVELAIRLTAHGQRPQDFFRSGWNVFDFLVIAASFMPGLRENATLLRLVRLSRVVRIVRLLPDLRVLIVAVGRSLPGMASLGILGILILYLYGMVGWLLFGEIAPEQYGTIGDAMLTLFVTLSLESLPDQVELAEQVGLVAIVYVISFALVAAFLLLNILIGVVINSLEEAREIEAGRLASERAERGEPDSQLALLDRVGDLRRELAQLERDLRRSGSRAA